MMKRLVYPLLGLSLGLIIGYGACLISQGNRESSWIAYVAEIVGFPGLLINTYLKFVLHIGNGQYPEGDTWGITFWNGIVWMLIFLLVGVVIRLRTRFLHNRR